MSDLLFFWVLLFSLITVAPVLAEEDANTPLFELSGSLPDVDSGVERREVDVPRIDSEYFELGAMAGMSSVEDFGSQFSVGARASVHATRSWFLELSYRQTKVSDNVFRRLGLPLFGDKQARDLQNVSALIGWNVFPGEAYLGDYLTFGSDVYLLAGAGTITFNRKEYFTGHFGMGVRLMPVDWASLRIEVLLSEYESDIFGFNQVSHNVDSTMSLNVFF